MGTSIKCLMLLMLSLTGGYNCFEIVRDYTAERLTCLNVVDCTNFLANQLKNTTCSCNGGTFMRTANGGVECLRKQSTTEECKFTFSGYEEEVPAISVESSIAGEFTESIISEQIDCYRMKFRSAQYLDRNFQWSDLPQKDFSIISSSLFQKSYLRWKNPFVVNKTMYSGQLLKFRFYCKSQVSTETIHGCAYGKIIGSRIWKNDDVDVCSIPLAPSPTKNGTKVETKKNPKEEDKIDMMLVGAIIATILLVVLIVAILIFCIRRRRIQKFAHNEEMRLPAISSQQQASDYVEPNSLFDRKEEGVEYEAYDQRNNDHTEFENKAYLTKLRPQSLLNNNANYDLPFQQQSSLLPKPVKQTKTALAKPVVSPTTNNIYEPIFGDYEYPEHIKPDDNSERPSYTNLKGIDSNTLQYHTLESNHRGDKSDTYMDMSSENIYD